MYDFYFGNRKEILNNPEDFLIFCKRLLPRWANGIPDSECIAIFRSLESLRDKKSILIETGSGASSLALFLHCALYNGKMYSWDTNASKGAYLRSMISDAMAKALGVDIHKIWTFIAFDSTDPSVGISVLHELGEKADFGYFDSWHTLNHLVREIKAFEMIASDKFIIALDDAYYTKRDQNFAYINMLRNKIGLASVKEPLENICNPFYVEINEYLNSNFSLVNKIDDYYKSAFEKDIFFDYFSSDRKFMNTLGMEERDNLSHRFDAWLVNK